jgi:hypothetical protein
MSLRTIGTLAQQRRAPPAAQGAAAAALTPEAAAAASGSFVKSLEAAIPTEVVALYTAIIAGCQSVLNQDSHSGYLAFRLIVYLVALACTVSIAFSAVRAAAGGTRQAVLSTELVTATLAFAAWGLLLPGSFLYVWLSSPLLSVVVITITAVTAFLLATVFAPKLRSKEPSAAGPASAGPPMTQIPPASAQHGAQPGTP